MSSYNIPTTGGIGDGGSEFFGDGGGGCVEGWGGLE